MLLSDGTPTRLGGSTSPTAALQTDVGYAGLDLLGAWAAYGELYKRQPWVHTLVRKLAVSTGRIPLKTLRRLDDGSRQSARETAYGELLRKPNPRMGGKRLWLWTASTFELYGEAIWVKLRDGAGRVRELHPVHPTNIALRRDPETGELLYLIAGGRLIVRERDIVHFAGYHPDSLVRGLSPCEPLRQTLESEWAARAGTSAMWRNGARPSMVLVHPGKISKEAQERLLAGWDAANSGVANWSKTALLEEGITPQVLQIDPDKMQYIESRRLDREECCAVWDVPPPVVHILDRATFSNITEQMRSMYRDTMGPRFNFYEDALETQLAPDFVALDGVGVYAEFLLDEMLRGAPETRVVANAQGIGTGQLTPNEARRLENRPDLEGGDELLVNAALIPLAAAAAVARTEADQAPVTRSVPGKKGLSAQDARRAESRLGRAAGWDDVDDAKVVGGVTGDATQLRGLLVAGRARGTALPVVRRQIAALVDDELVPADLTPPDLVEAP